MFCESYRRPLIDAAASSEPLPRLLQAHVDTCGRCASALSEERMLCAKVDELAGIRVRGELSSSFLAKVRVEIDKAAKTKRTAQAWLSPAVAAAAVLVFAASTLFHRSTLSTHRTSNESASSGSQSAKSLQADSSVLPPVPVSRKKLRNMPARNTPNLLKTKRGMLPRDEREALLIFADQLHSRPELAKAFATPETSARNEGLEIPPVQIEELKLRPLQDEASESGKAAPEMREN